ncbi:MAG: hypothetical protein ACRCVV_18360, partial [Shewanella sp.]
AHNLNMEQQQMMLLIAGLIGMLLSRALSFKRADFDRRRTRVKLRKNPKKEKSSAALAAEDKPEMTDNPATVKADMKDKPQTATVALAATTKPKVKMVHQAHRQSKTGPTQPSDLDSDATG